MRILLQLFGKQIIELACLKRLIDSWRGYALRSFFMNRGLTNGAGIDHMMDDQLNMHLISDALPRKSDETCTVFALIFEDELQCHIKITKLNFLRRRAVLLS